MKKKISKSKYEYLDFMYKNQHMGFDEFADKLSLDKQDVKDMWNANIGDWKMFPNTYLKTTRIGKSKYRLIQDVKIHLTEDFLIVIKEGFEFDYASVPKFMWWYISPDDDGIALPALLHDVLYVTELFDRNVCDAFFLMAMRERGLLPKRKMYAAYYAVRCCGWVVWNKHDPEIVLSNKKKYIEYR